MKTAISVPDRIYRQVEEHRERLGISRSEFFATAAQRYADELERESLTERINAALDAIGDDPEYDDTIAFTRRAAELTFERIEFDSPR